MRVIPCYRVDAFATRALAGNPACICPLEQWLPVSVMQSIANENAVSETGFFVARGAAFDLRWFTPTTEVELCGHATLAAGFIVMTLLEPSRSMVQFHTRGGQLEVSKLADEYCLDLPQHAPHVEAAPKGLAKALNVAAPSAWLKTPNKRLCIVETAELVRALAPDFGALLRLADVGGVIVSARGTGQDSDVDFVSRYFAPHRGVPEDPVTGSAHCVLAPYWAQQLSKRTLRARQVERARR